MSIDKYVKVIRPHLNRLLNRYNNEWKILLAIVNKVVSLVDNYDKQKIYKKLIILLL